MGIVGGGVKVATYSETVVFGLGSPSWPGRFRLGQQVREQSALAQVGGSCGHVFGFLQLDAHGLRLS